MNWLQSVYDVIGVPYPRLSVALAATVGAIMFGGGWWLVGRQHAKDHAVVPQVALRAAGESELSPPQLRLLELLAGYQRQFAASKLVIDRAAGTLHFDGNPERGQGISLLKDLYGASDAGTAARFEELVESMPSEYVRLLPEARFDNPFVASITPAGMKRLGQSPTPKAGNVVVSGNVSAGDGSATASGGSARIEGGTGYNSASGGNENVGPGTYKAGDAGPGGTGGDLVIKGGDAK